MTLMVNADAACFHCGDPIPPGTDFSVEYDGSKRFMCCAGCQAVARLIAGAGLNNYYRYRQALGQKVTADLLSRRAMWRTVDDRKTLWGPQTVDGRHDLLLQTEGIRCAACSWLIRSHLENLPGIDAVQVDIATGFTRVTWIPAETRLSSIAAALYGLGYTPHLPIASAEEEGRRKERRDSMKRLGVAGLGMMQVMMYAVGLYAGDAQGMSPAEKGFLTWVSLLVTLPVLFYSGRIFFAGAVQGIRAGRPGMDLPVALAIGIAFIASCVNFFSGSGEVWFDSVVMFIFFLTLGRHVELVLRHKNIQAGTALARLIPEWAQRKGDLSTETIPATDLAPGDVVVVRPGETFPADGKIAVGTTDVDEAILTGESKAHIRKPGDFVVAGSINLSQPVEVQISASGSDTTVSAIGRLMLSQRAAESAEMGIPAWLVPMFISSVIVLASLTWIAWQFLDATRALPATLAVLVASCPCALSLAIPAVWSAASRRLLREGILLTQGDALKRLDRVDIVVFDKTGTLTRGFPTVIATEINPVRNEFDRQTLLGIAAALESVSSHPISKAFIAPGTREKLSGFKVVPAAGVEGVRDGVKWRIGSQDFVMEDLGKSQRGSRSDQVWLADEIGWCAKFTLEDSLRENAHEVVRKLKESHLDVRICSGDADQPVRRIAEMLDIRTWLAGQKPRDKLALVRQLQDDGKNVLMIGDGVNDAPVLAAADVSMTVTGASELANSSADLILTAESMDRVLISMAVSRSANRLVHQNLAWALIYNLSAIPLAVSGVLAPWMAALGMSLSSLLVVLNASRLALPGLMRDKMPT